MKREEGEKRERERERPAAYNHPLFGLLLMLFLAHSVSLFSASSSLFSLLLPVFIIKQCEDLHLFVVRNLVREWDAFL